MTKNEYPARRPSDGLFNCGYFLCYNLRVIRTASPSVAAVTPHIVDLLTCVSGFLIRGLSVKRYMYEQN